MLSVNWNNLKPLTSSCSVISYIPVKASERLPGKHMMELCGRPMIEIIRSRLRQLGEVIIESRIDLPMPCERDDSASIMHLIGELSTRNQAFMLVAGDMPFFTSEDVRLLVSRFAGKITVPVHEDGKMEPLFAIYSGRIEPGKSMHSMISGAGFDAVDAGSFSEFAFFNVNTQSEYVKATELCKKLQA